MAQSAGNSKNPLKINPFWERASTEPPLEWTKGAAILEMAVFVKDGIEIRNLLRAKPQLADPYVTHTDGTKQTHGSVAIFFSAWGQKAKDKFNKNDLTLYYTM